ncbi:unnamed protein product [Moneuplotes crassus]|uniref:Uncharacterized protein n=1 Tax=Euplotes crassus TaxID=5936 RepID=A0AAD2D2S2_EUPCR|nr:unnamed protein product [Moneuplotes crassus]
MQRISRSQHPIAKKWQCFGCCLLISMIVYFLNFMLASTFAFGGNGGAFGIICYIIDIAFIFVAMFTYGQFVGQKGGKLIAGLIIGAVGFANILTLMILIISSRNNDCEDSFDCPLYGSFPVIIIAMMFIAAMIFPGLYFTAMILAHVPSWDPKKIPGEGEGGDENVAVVIDQNAPIQIMDPNAGQNNNPYVNPNPSNPQPQMFAPQVIIMEPMPMDPNAGIQMGMQPNHNNQNAYQPNSQAPYNPTAPAMYTPSGPAATGKDNIEMGQPV